MQTGVSAVWPFKTNAQKQTYISKLISTETFNSQRKLLNLQVFSNYSSLVSMTMKKKGSSAQQSICYRHF